MNDQNAFKRKRRKTNQGTCEAVFGFSSGPVCSRPVQQCPARLAPVSSFLLSGRIISCVRYTTSSSRPVGRRPGEVVCPSGPCPEPLHKQRPGCIVLFVVQPTKCLSPILLCTYFATTSSSSTTKYTDGYSAAWVFSHPPPAMSRRPIKETAQILVADSRALLDERSFIN